MADYFCPRVQHFDPCPTTSESAANDGLAYPFLSISLYLVLEPDLRTVFQNWLIIGWFCKSVVFITEFI